MLRRLFVVGAVVALVAVAVSATALAAGDQAAGKTLRVVEHAVSDSVVDLAPSGDSLGDVLAFGNPIFDAADDHEIGRDQGYCVRTNVGEAWECNWTVILARDSITVEGPFYDDLRDSPLAITGGTGAYLNARGQMTLHARNAGGTAFDFIYHIVR